MKTMIVLVATLAVAFASPARAAQSDRQEREAVHSLKRGIVWQRSQVWHWQDLRGAPRSLTSFPERHVQKLWDLRWRAKLWNQRRKVAYHAYRAFMRSMPPHYRGWLCIHSREAAWNAQTGNGFYGGLQMTYGWMGVVSNAALLSPLQQMWLAEKVSARNGFTYSWMKGQWPNTYPPCAAYFT